MAYNKMTLINGVLGLYSRSRVINESDSPDAETISDALTYLLPFFRSCTLPWGFLTGYYVTTTVALDTGIDFTAEGLGYVYSLPSDFEAVKEVFYASRYILEPPYIVTPMGKLEMKYIKRGDNYALFPPHFMTYLIYFVAVQLCPTITKDLKLLEGLTVQMEKIKALAASYENSLTPSSGINGKNIYFCEPNNFF